MYTCTLAYRKTGRKTHQSKIQKNKKTSFVFCFLFDIRQNNKSQICLFRSQKYGYQILSILRYNFAFEIQFEIQGLRLYN